MQYSNPLSGWNGVKAGFGGPSKVLPVIAMVVRCKANCDLLGLVLAENILKVGGCSHRCQSTLRLDELIEGRAYINQCVDATACIHT